MKKYFIIILAALLIVSCGQAPDAIMPGDLLFVAIPADYDPNPQAVVANDPQATAAGQNPALLFIHAAILDVDTTGIWIIDATLKHGVDRHPLDTFLREFTLKDGSLPTLEVYRLKDQTNIPAYIQAAKARIGEPYDIDFQQDNGKHYCTELIYDSYVDNDGHIFSAAPINFRNTEGEMPVYWTFLFDLIGTEIPQGNQGTLPQSMREEIRSSDNFIQTPPRHLLRQNNPRKVG